MARLCAEPSIAFAVLNHRLKAGFFLTHRFFIEVDKYFFDAIEISLSDVEQVSQAFRKTCRRTSTVLANSGHIVGTHTSLAPSPVFQEPQANNEALTSG
jgi:hypothetical protein